VVVTLSRAGFNRDGRHAVVSAQLTDTAVCVEKEPILYVTRKPERGAAGPRQNLDLEEVD
jgi:hypothetical protein